ncbi:MAG: FHA domain-containing protein [Planctomycetota bacterium]
MAFLVIETDKLNPESRSIVLGTESIIGREATNVVFIDDSRVSRQHAKIIRETDGSYCIIDLGSRNGTIVNNERVFRRKLIPRDRIIIGRTVLVFNEESPAPEKKDLGSEIQKLVQDIDTTKDKSSVKTKETVNLRNNNTASKKESSGWVKALVFISFLLFFIVVLFWAKWAGEKLIAHLVKSRDAKNIPSSTPPK